MVGEITRVRKTIHNLIWDSMKLKDAVKIAEDDPRVKEILDSGGFLCSAHVMVKPDEEIKVWDLFYFDPESRKIISVGVGETVKVGNPEDPLNEEVGRIDVSLLIEGSEAIKIGGTDGAQRILLSLMKREKHIWNVISLKGNLLFLNVVDGESGDILEKKVINPFRIL
mgnify:CR=1 FL=1